MNNTVIRLDASIEQLLLRHRKELSERDHEANKGTYGRLTLVAGSHGMAGAAFLSGLAAFRCGIGMVKYLGPECNRTILQTLLPEAMYDALPEAAMDGHQAEGSKTYVTALAEKLKDLPCMVCLLGDAEHPDNGYHGIQKAYDLAYNF